MKRLFVLAAAVLAIGASGCASAPAEESNQAASLREPTELTLGEDLSVLVDSQIMQFTFAIPRGDLHQFPRIAVVEEYGSFECTLVGLKVDVRYDAETDSLTDQYTLDVDWFPGADLSGCFVEISAPGADETTRLELFMSF